MSFAQAIAKDGKPRNPPTYLDPQGVCHRGDAAAAQGAPSPQTIGDEKSGGKFVTVRQNETDGFTREGLSVAGGVSVTVRPGGTDGFALERVPVVGVEAQENGDNDDDDDKYSEFAEEDRQE